MSSPVGGHARVDAGVPGRDGLDDQRVHPVLSHQHLVGAVLADGLAVQQPTEIGGWQPTDLNRKGSANELLCYRNKVRSRTPKTPAPTPPSGQREALSIRSRFLLTYLFIFGCIGSLLRCMGFSLQWLVLL